MIQHILVAVDGSEGSANALRHACDLAQQTGATVLALTAVEAPVPVALPPFEGYATTAPHPSPEELATAQKLINTAKAQLGERLVERLETGPAAEVVLRVAAEVSADLIVVGARGLNPVMRWLLGSVSDRIVHHADRPVLVIR